MRKIKDVAKKIPGAKSMYHVIRFIALGTIPNHELYRQAVRWGGLEVGGLSRIFDRFSDIGLYQHMFRLDLCNYKEDTGRKINYTHENIPKKYKRLIRSFIYLDGTDLHEISDNTYDFVLTSQTLEHIANPIKALKEWARVIKPGGYIITVVPNKLFCFDRNREYTVFQHMLQDYLSNTPESDDTHIAEIITTYDFSMDPSGSLEKIKQRALENAELRSMHHHVFSENSLREIHEYCSLKVVDLQTYRRNIVALGKKLS